MNDAPDEMMENGEEVCVLRGTQRDLSQGLRGLCKG